MNLESSQGLSELVLRAFSIRYLRNSIVYIMISSIAWLDLSKLGKKL